MKSRAETDFEALLAKRISQARLMRGYENASEFARLLGVAPNTVYRWERGEVTPQAYQVVAIARAAGVTTDWLLLGQADDVSHDLARWLETPRGKSATPEAIAWMQRVPVTGFRPSDMFFDLALLAFERGLTPEDAAAVARYNEIIRR